jgi:uncharacterized protein
MSAAIRPEQAAPPRPDALSTWKPSRFNMWAHDEGGALLVYNSFSSAFARFEGAAADAVAGLLKGDPLPGPEGLIRQLAASGFLVPAASDELLRARLLHESQFKADQRLQLILMPTEQCNFRCVYCYEDFARGRMRPDVIEGVVSLVQREAPRLKALSVGWFGGEPLSALDIVDDVSRRLLAICEEHGVRYDADMTTNAYLLDDERMQRCFSAQVSKFQITLDGPAETHDKLRVLAGGAPTFERILGNLLRLRDATSPFHVRLRVNFTPETAPHMPRFLEFLGRNFGADPRFSISFHPVAALGGPHDHLLEHCGQVAADAHEIDFMESAGNAGFGLDSWKESLEPFGSTCYAADPRSFVIGSDGTVYKCTVAFREPRNRVGAISPDGDLHLVDALLALWTRSGEEVDTGCQQCAFRPTCQGNVCPLDRLENDGEKVCPPFKRNVGRVLPLLARQPNTSRASCEVC